MADERDPGRALDITVWGPSAAGKTMFLAQLYDQHTGAAKDWEVLPTETSLAFVRQMRATMSSANVFPTATAVGAVERIVYRAIHRPSGTEIVIETEDRAGRDFEEHEASTEERLLRADGLLLLLDPGRAAAERERELWETLEGLHVASGRRGARDPRPIAVCISKADRLIHTADDLERAERTPDDFARRFLSKTMLRALEKFCARYRLFAISAAGVRVRFGTVEPVVFFDQALEPRICPQGGRPLNLMAPFAWMLETLSPPGGSA